MKIFLFLIQKPVKGTKETGIEIVQCYASDPETAMQCVKHTCKCTSDQIDALQVEETAAPHLWPTHKDDE